MVIAKADSMIEMHVDPLHVIAVTAVPVKVTGGITAYGLVTVYLDSGAVLTFKEHTFVAASAAAAKIADIQQRAVYGARA
jgi:hypothetical protein